MAGNTNGAGFEVALDAFGVGGSEPGIDEAEAEDGGKGDGVEEGGGNGVDADEEEGGEEVIGQGAAEKADIFRIVEGAVEDAIAIEPAAAGDAAERDDKEHGGRDEHGEESGRQPEEIDENIGAESHPEADGEQEGGDGENQLNGAFLGVAREDAQVPVGQLATASIAGAAQDFEGEAEGEPEGEDVEAENPREPGIDPGNRFFKVVHAGDIGGRKSDNKGIDEQKTAEEDLGNPMTVGSDLVETIF